MQAIFPRLILILFLLNWATLAQSQTVLRTAVVGPVPCAAGEDFVVRLYLDTSRNDIRSFGSEFTWFANLYELRSVTKAPGFSGEFEKTSNDAGPVGVVAFGVTSTQLFSGLSAGAMLDFTFRTRTARITGQPLIEPPLVDPTFLTTSFSTFSGDVNFAATNHATCTGAINPGDQFGILRTQLAEDLPCHVGGQFDVAFELETNAANLDRIVSGFTYDGDQFEFVSVRRGPAFTGTVDSTGNEEGSIGTFVLNLDGEDEPAPFSNGVVMIARFEVREENLSGEEFTKLPTLASTETRFFVPDDDFFGSLVLDETHTVTCSAVAPTVEAETWAIY